MATFTNWQLSTGGFGGGADQLAHLATTYAAVNALAIAGTTQAYDVLNKYGTHTHAIFFLKKTQELIL